MCSIDNNALCCDCTTGHVFRCFTCDKKWFVQESGTDFVPLTEYATDFGTKVDNFLLLAMDGEKTDIKKYLMLLGAAMDFVITDVYNNCRHSDFEFHSLGGVVDDKTPITLLPFIRYEGGNWVTCKLDIYDKESHTCLFTIDEIHSEKNAREILGGFRMFAKRLKNVTFEKAVVVK